MASSWCFDPVASLPGDIAAICLSYVGVHSLLGAAQHVNHAWRDAIDGGLPAVWHRVCLGRFKLTEEQLAVIANKSHGNILSLTQPRGSSPLYGFEITAYGFSHFCSSSSLRVLVIENLGFKSDATPELSCFPLLEEVSFRRARNIAFPPLQFLKSVRCVRCGAVQGLRNLPALTKLVLRHIFWEVDDVWPASLREVTIYHFPSKHPQLLTSISSLQQPVQLETDWSFARMRNDMLSPRYEEPAFLPGFTTLQRFSLKLNLFAHTPHFVFKHLSAMTFLRELKLASFTCPDPDLQCLVEFRNLQRLTLSHLNGLSSSNRALCNLALISSLTSLSITECFSDYSRVGMCIQLRELTICSYDHRLSLMEAQAVSKMQLEKLKLYVPLKDPSTFSYFCTMHYLRELYLWASYNDSCIPASAFASLPNLSRLERFDVSKIGDIAELVNCLVQMPRLRFIRALSMMAGDEHRLSEKDKARLRNALPKLEVLVD